MSSEEFASDALKVCVAQLAKDLGYDSIHASALDTFTEVVKGFLIDIGRSAHSYSNLCNRTTVNLMDAAVALEEVELPLQSLRDFAKTAAEIPYARSRLAFPSRRKPKNITLLSQGKDAVSGLPKHIPSWCPPLPLDHTYIDGGMKAKPSLPKEEAVKIRSKARRHVGKTLLKFAELAGKEDEPAAKRLRVNVAEPLAQDSLTSAVLLDAATAQDKLSQSKSTFSTEVAPISSVPRMAPARINVPVTHAEFTDATGVKQGERQQRQEAILKLNHRQDGTDAPIEEAE